MSKNIIFTLLLIATTKSWALPITGTKLSCSNELGHKMNIELLEVEFSDLWFEKFKVQGEILSGPDVEGLPFETTIEVDPIRTRIHYGSSIIGYISEIKSILSIKWLEYDLIFHVIKGHLIDANGNITQLKCVEQ